MQLKYNSILCNRSEYQIPTICLLFIKYFIFINKLCDPRCAFAKVSYLCHFKCHLTWAAIIGEALFLSLAERALLTNFCSVVANLLFSIAKGYSLTACLAQWWKYIPKVFTHSRTQLYFLRKLFLRFTRVNVKSTSSPHPPIQMLLHQLSADIKYQLKINKFTSNKN